MQASSGKMTCADIVVGTFLSVCSLPGTVLSSQHVVSHLITAAAVCGEDLILSILQMRTQRPRKAMYLAECPTASKWSWDSNTVWLKGLSS